jgi:hypothetical protein
MNKNLLVKIIFWFARITSAASVGMLLLFIFGEGFNPTKLSLKEAALFLFFPFGVMLGMLFGWKSELAGGLISILSLTGFCIIESIDGGFPGSAFFVFIFPGFLFLLSFFIQKKLHTTKITK